MAQKAVFTVTATEIKSPDGKFLLSKTDPAKVIGLSTFGDSFIFMDDGTEDTRILTASGWNICIQEERADFATALSATSITGS